MAFILSVGRLIPLAVRLSLAGGTAYGAAKSGVWSDSITSQESLRKLKLSWREIEYPPVSHSELAVSESTLSTIKSSMAESWNSAIKGICESAITGANGSEERSVYKLSRKLLKKWTDK